MPPPEAPGRFVRANGIRQHYLECGRGPIDVVICHKVTAGAETWLEWAERLPADYHVVIPDLRGHGYTDQPESGYSLVDYARDVTGLIDALDLARPIVVGHSLGARIALHLAAFHPASVRGVVAIDPPVSGPGRRRYPYSLDSFEQLRSEVEARGVDALASSSSSYTPRQASLRARYALMYSQSAVRESWFGFHLESVHALAARIAVPALLLYGERGVILDDEARELVQLCPALEAVRVEGAGHNVPWDNWPVVAAALTAFVRSCEASAEIEAADVTRDPIVAERDRGDDHARDDGPADDRPERPPLPHRL